MPQQSKPRPVLVLLGKPNPEGVRRLARLLVERAANDVFNRTQHSDAVEAATPTASEEKVNGHLRPEEA